MLLEQDGSEYDQDHVVLIGSDSMQHYGLRQLTSELAVLTDRCLLTFLTYSDWYGVLPLMGSKKISLVIFCLSHRQSFPYWLVILLISYRNICGRFVIFVDEPKSCQDIIFLLRRILWVDIFDHNSSLKEVTKAIKQSNGYFPRLPMLLTDQELQALKGFVFGQSALRQAKVLGVKRVTIYQHRHNCAVKMGLKNLRMLFTI